MAYDERAIANEFIEIAKAHGKTLTNMQLQKLPYIAHGWSLAILQQPLIKKNPQTWPYGPVYPALYDSLKRYGSGPVTDFIHDGDPAYAGAPRGDIVKANNLTELQNLLIRRVWEEYGDKDGWTLSAITHKESTPWSKIMREKGAYSEIPNSEIEEHYHNLLRRPDNA